MIRYTLAFFAGLFFCALTYVFALGTAGDFMWLYAGSSFLFSGVDPYAPGLDFGAGYLDRAPLFYPLPAVLLASPFTLYTPRVASSLMVGLSASALVFVAWSRPRNRLVLLVLLSFPALALCRGAQLSLWLLVAALLPGFWWLVVVKPSFLLPIFLRHASVLRSSWRPFPFLPGAALLLVLFVVSLAWLPAWPLGWFSNLHAGSVLAREHRPDYYGSPGVETQSSEWSEHRSPALIWPVGPAVFLVLWRYRDPRSWLLVSLALVPQAAAFYDAVLLFLLPRSVRGGLLLLISGWLLFLSAQLADVWVSVSVWQLQALLYLPAAAVVLYEQESL